MNPQGKGKANCLKCGATCAVRQLHCEDEVMKGRTAIECNTFMEDEKPKDVQIAFVVLQELHKRGMLRHREYGRR